VYFLYTSGLKSECDLIGSPKKLISYSKLQNRKDLILRVAGCGFSSWDLRWRWPYTIFHYLSRHLPVLNVKFKPERGKGGWGTHNQGPSLGLRPKWHAKWAKFRIPISNMILRIQSISCVALSREETPEIVRTSSNMLLRKLLVVLTPPHWLALFE
jgi:hypothetical protein